MLMALRYDIKNDGNTKTYIYFKPTESDNLDDIKLLLEDDGNFEIYSNDEDETPDNSYKNVTNYIYRLIDNSNFLCKGLNADYILDAFDDVDAVVIIGSSMKILPNQKSKVLYIL